jgi:hypothetical protein
MHWSHVPVNEIHFTHVQFEVVLRIVEKKYGADERSMQLHEHRFTSFRFAHIIGSGAEAHHNDNLMIDNSKYNNRISTAVSSMAATGLSGRNKSQ